MKIIGVLGVAILTFVAVYFWQYKGDDEMFILPKNYVGKVLVIFDQKTGLPKAYNQGKRVYEIPEDGVLKTQFNPNEGWHSLWKYYYREDQILTEIAYVTPDKDLDEVKIQVCCFSSGLAQKNPGADEVKFIEFYVGTKNEIENALMDKTKSNPADFVNYSRQ